MDTINDSITTVNEAVTKAVGALQSQVVSMHQNAAAAVAKASEQLPAWLPSAEPQPSVDSFIAQAFEFQAQRLEADKQFTLELLDAWTPKPAARSKSAK